MQSDGFFNLEKITIHKKTTLADVFLVLKINSLFLFRGSLEGLYV